MMTARAGSATEHPRHSVPRLPVGQNPHRRVLAGRAHDAASRVGRRAAHVEISDWGRVLRPAWRWTQEEELLQGQLPLKDVAFAQPERALDVERRQDLAVKNQIADVGSKFG